MDSNRDERPNDGGNAQETGTHVLVATGGITAMFGCRNLPIPLVLADVLTLGSGAQANGCWQRPGREDVDRN